MIDHKGKDDDEVFPCGENSHIFSISNFCRVISFVYKALIQQSVRNGYFYISSTKWLTN